MSPDVARAIVDLRGRGVLGAAPARLFLRVARGELISLYYELRLLLYAGVTLVVAGVGLLVRENLDRLGPVAIAFAIGLPAALSFLWISQRAPAFSWGPALSPHFAFDYILLLGVLLASADLAYIEAHFTPLGANWPWHLLYVSLAMAAIAIRFDSRVVFSLALSTFASWRGVSVSFVESGFWSNFVSATRLNTAGCGFLFVIVGLFLSRERKKPHFEPVATYLGYVLALGSLASGALTEEPSWNLWAFALLTASVSLAIHSLYRRRFPLFAMGAFAAYVACSRFIVPALPDEESLYFLWFLVSSVVVLFTLVRVHRTLSKAS
jgi:hypothetical protein